MSEPREHDPVGDEPEPSTATAGEAEEAGPIDYGDPAQWRNDAFFAASGDEAEAAAGWDWVGSDIDLDAASDDFARAAIDALSAGEELLARDLSRLTRDELELD